VNARRTRLSYGWVIVAASLFLMVASTATSLCFGLFLKPLAAEFGWSRAAVSLAMSILMAVYGIVGVPMGKVTDRYGARAPVGAGVVIGTLSFLLLSRVDSLWQFYLCFGVGIGIYSGCAYAPAISTISKWFDVRRRTLAIGVALLGIVVGQMVLSPIISKVIEANGWRTGWILLGIVGFVFGLPAVVVMGKVPGGLEERDRPEVGAAPRSTAQSAPARLEGLSTKQAARTGPFWMLVITGAVLGFGWYAFTAHIVPDATDLGLSATVAALILTVSSVGGIFGTLLASPMALKLGPRRALLLLIAVTALTVFLLIFTASAWSFYAVTIVMGFSFSAVVPVRMGVVPSLFGLRAIGTIIGVGSLSFSVGAIAGPFVAGYVFDSTGSYDLAFLVSGVLLIAGLVAIQFLWPPKDSPATGKAPIWRAGDRLE
jgi:MFS family permease